MSDVRLDFRVLGALQVRSGGESRPIGAPKQRAVLAMLLLHRNRALSVDALIDAVWDASPVPAARTGIHSYVSNLRRILGGAGHQLLESVPPGYRLSVADSDCDLGRFVIEKNAGLRAVAAGRFVDACTHLTAALDEWRGPFLDDLREFAFTEPYSTALTEDSIVVHTALAESEIACGRAASAIPRLEELSAEQPFREPLWVQLITAYYAVDRQFDAIEAYQRLKSNLDEHLGVQPGPTVRRLHERILRQESLDIPAAVQTTATRRLAALAPHTDALAVPAAVAELRGSDGRRHTLQGSTRIGRRGDNDIVLEGDDISRYHAVVIDTGTEFVISDLRSTNGVEVRGRRVKRVATLTDGDHIRIGEYDFTFRVDPH